jgi:hypothetical protein
MTQVDSNRDTLSIRNSSTILKLHMQVPDIAKPMKIFQRSGMALDDSFRRNMFDWPYPEPTFFRHSWYNRWETEASIL